MVVLVLTACPSGLRGFLTRWLMEISAGVFVGKVNARVRERIWERVVEMIGNGRAILVRSVRSEQGLDVRVHGHHWEPIDIEGITLILRPKFGTSHPSEHGSKHPSSIETGWSNAAKRRRFRR